MSRFVSTVDIDASPTAVFDFHTDVRNLPKIMPLVKLVAYSKPALEQGAQFSVTLKPFALPVIEWLIEWSEFVHGAVLTDRQLRGPLKRLRHRRTFVQLPSGATRLTDDVEYEVKPGMRTLNAMVGPLVLAIVFRWRERLTKHALEHH